MNMSFEKKIWIFLGAISSIIGFLVYLLLDVAFGTYSVTTPLFAFTFSLAYFITWSTVGVHHLQKKIRKKKSKLCLIKNSKKQRFCIKETKNN